MLHYKYLHEYHTLFRLENFFYMLEDCRHYFMHIYFAKINFCSDSQEDKIFYRSMKFIQQQFCKQSSTKFKHCVYTYLCIII